MVASQMIGTISRSKMELSDLWVVFAAGLGFYVVVFGFLRRLNELWTFVKLGRKVYRALPPGDMGWPFVGSTLSFYKAFTTGGDPDSFITHLLSHYGRIGMYKSHLYGRPSIIVTDPEICRQIYLDEERFKPSYPKSVKILNGDGSLSKIDHRHHHRLIAGPINGSKALSRYVGYIEQTVVSCLEEWSSMREPIELLNELKTLTFKVIIRVFVGSALSEPLMAELERLYAELALTVMSIFPYDLPGFTFHRSVKARKEIVKILGSIVEERIRVLAENEGEIEEKCQMDAAIEALDENGAKLLSKNAIVDLLLGVVHAGHHTSAHAAMWALVYISEHPQVFQKAKEEQEAIMKQRPATQKALNFKEIKQMKYLTKVINETLRKNTIAVTNFREAKVDVNINGYTVPKGWVVPIWIRAVHMDPQLYPNPKEFDPSRWDNYTPKAGIFMPFGLGNRLCPGSELARLEITILLHHLLLDYKLERVNPKSQLTYIPIPRPLDNCLSKITRIPRE